MTECDAQVLVIGSGIAGLSFALKAAREASVLLVTKKGRAASNTNWAKGGIAAALGPDDTPELHIADTLRVGVGLGHREAVDALAHEGPARVRELIAWGTEFDRSGGELALGMEGGHSRRRIAHTADRTGRAIEGALLAAVEADPNISVLEDHLAVDLIVVPDATTGTPRCTGAIVLDHSAGEVMSVVARMTFLATGGCGQVYQHTTNPPIATGDGIAMAYRAGARVGNMEFIQFHPTALYPTADPALLISEAVRGEGGILRRQDGTPLMDAYDARGSLAPRDIVARAIDFELKLRDERFAVLDTRTIPETAFRARFPSAVEGCEAAGYDPFTEIPVVPAAHYVCGGVFSDSVGRTSLPGLFVAGEAACTGVHGANRLASNSLLEALVYSHRAAAEVAGEVAGRGQKAPSHPNHEATGASGENTALHGPRRELRALMWELAGIARTDERLAVALARLRELAVLAREEFVSGPWTVDGVEFRNLVTSAELIVGCALWRRESRGLHYNSDHPETVESFRVDSVATEFSLQ